MKDQKGKNQMVFNKDVSKEDLLMGDKIDDYEILQVLGEGSFGYVAKAKSRLNHKIYAIKQLNFSSNQKKKDIDLVENEVAILKNLNHPLITRYYKSFKEGNCLYIVMEFMDNGDLSKLIKGNQTLKKPIEEERLWNIFIQALRSLEFVHSRGLIHRDIKPENLFISLDGTIKLGDFGVAANYKDKNNKNAPKNQQNIKNKMNMQGNLGKIDCKGTVVGTAPFMSPEMIKNTEYDLKTDVYSMGCAFFETMYWTVPRMPGLDIAGLVEGNNVLKLIDVNIKNNKDYYSKELVDLVKKMIEMKKELRPDSSTILNLFITEYNKKYSKSSNIGSVLSCLYCYTELFQYFKNPNNEQNISSNQDNISYAFLYGLNSMINNSLNAMNAEDWKTTLFKIRTLLAKHRTMYEANTEINPRYFLSFLLGRMHKELNLKKGMYQNPFGSLFAGQKDIDMNMQQSNMNINLNINFSKKDESFQFFMKYFMENNDSIISNYFYGNMKNKTVCVNCQLTTYTYQAFNFITFNLDLVKKYLIKNNLQNMQNQLNLLHCFIMQNDTLIQISNYSRYCRNCKQNTEHSERKQFSTFPRYFIVCLDRGNECENKTKIFYDNMLDLSGKHDNPNSYSYYMLKGIIKRLDKNDKEHYISLYFDYNQNSWIIRDDSQIKKLSSPFDHQEGYEVMFFYEAIINNNNNNMNQNMNNNMGNNMNNNMGNNMNNNMGNNMNNNMGNNMNQNMNNNMNQNMNNNMGNNMNMNQNMNNNNMNQNMNNNMSNSIDMGQNMNVNSNMGNTMDSNMNVNIQHLGINNGFMNQGQNMDQNMNMNMNQNMNNMNLTGIGNGMNNNNININNSNMAMTSVGPMNMMNINNYYMQGGMFNNNMNNKMNFN